MIAEKKRASVIIPTFNRREILRRAIDSALARTGRADEVIVVDDGSTDGTADALRDLPARVRVLRTENGGPAAARNAGIRAARGSYIAFLDSDDEWIGDDLDERIEALRRDPLIGLSYGAARNVDSEDRPVATRPRVPRSGNVLRSLLHRNFVTTSTAIVPRRALRRVGLFDEALDHSMDWDLWLRLSEEFAFHYHPEPVALYRFHDGQRIRNRPRVDACRRQILEKTLLRYRRERPHLVGIVRRLLSYRLLRLGRLQIQAGDRPAARESFRAAAELRPMSLLTAARYGLLTRSTR
jgi:glycosyltransferase involved in cell wall biosynthesis